MKDFKDYIMVCNSTQNQVVNLLPALQFGLKDLLIVSTELADKKKWTERLTEILNKHKISANIITINSNDEKSVPQLTERLTSLTNKYKKVIWNISGGQKIPTISLHNAFSRRIKAGFDDMVVYVEGNDGNIWFYDKDFKTEKVRSNVHFSLEDILHIAGYRICDNKQIYPQISSDDKGKISIAKKALIFYESNDIFREAFFSLMRPPDEIPRNLSKLKELIKKELNKIKPVLKDINIKKTGYENLESNISIMFNRIFRAKTIGEAKEIFKKLKIIMQPDQIYEDYWNSIKRECVNRIIEELNNKKQPLLNRKITKNEQLELISQIRGLGGNVKDSEDIIYKSNVRFSKIPKNSELFEWMVASSVLEAIEEDKDIKSAISEVHYSVKTQRIELDCNKPDSEIDVLIITKFGTLIVLEAKTYDFSGDTAKSRESVAYKKSGPFARAIIIGPVLKSMVKIKSDGTDEFPEYVDPKTRAQKETAEINGVLYWYLDEIKEKLRNELRIGKFSK